MNSRNQNIRRMPQRASHALVLPASMLATLLALPVHAGITLPEKPLTSAAEVAPNILFLLDTSNSMRSAKMPNKPPATSKPNVANFAYTRNTLSYNPSRTYGTWYQADGTPVSDALYTIYPNAAANWLKPIGLIDLRDDTSCYTNVGTDGGDENDPGDPTSNNVCGGVQTFYVPKDLTNTTAAYLGDGDNYYRYQILTNNSGVSRMVRCEYDHGPDKWTDGCVNATPTGRSLQAELNNYSTWYSYHRTRHKVAKGGAGEAFVAMGQGQRVAFRTIYNGAPYDTHRMDFQIGDGNDGRFTGATRQLWYDKLFDADGDLGTPNRIALDRAGLYFSNDPSQVPDPKEGPYGHYLNGAAVDVANQYSCRQNFTILATDGYWNDEAGHGWSYKYNYDALPASQRAGNADGTNGLVISRPDATTYQYTPTAPYQDGATARSNTLADVAMKYWKNDLNTDLVNNVPSSASKDPAFWQHMVTFGISIGLAGTDASQALGWTSVPGVLANPNHDWEPTSSAGRIDDLLHAAVNSRGAFVSAADPETFTASLKAALLEIGQRQASQSSVATNSSSLRTGSKVFDARYQGGDWKGELLAYPVTASGGVNPTPAWSASIPAAWATRKVYTMGGTFPTTAQLADLDRGGGAINFAVSDTDNAEYIKGNKTLEGSGSGALRQRQSLLGDIVNSSLEYVEFTNTVYAGANDGMLHAFNGATGVELFSYIPGILPMEWVDPVDLKTKGLGTLSRGDYNHQYFVDGPIVSSSRALTPGKNILVGALGRGGSGVYALDVSNPGSMSTSPGLWEVNSSSTGYGDLGRVVGKPLVASVDNGAVKSAAVIIGNGVNSPNDRAVLYVTNIETGAIIKTFDTGVGDATNPNGLFAPTGVLGDDGRTLAYVYAGDMRGNLWKFDLKANTFHRVFTAGDGLGSQPITGGISVSIDPTTWKQWVHFGTGRFMTTADAADRTANAQYMYGVIDDGTTTTVALTQLQSQSLTGSGTTRTAATNAPLTSGMMGWYISLPGAGERVVQDTQVVANVVVTPSMIPTNNGCDTGGTGYINVLDAFSGTSTASPFLDSNGDGVVNASDTIVASMDFGVGMPTTPILFPGRLVVGGSAANAAGPASGITTPYTWSRVTWRENRKD